MKIDIEIDDDSAFLKALAADISASEAKGEKTEDFEIDRPITPRLTCLAVSCNGDGQAK